MTRARSTRRVVARPNGITRAKRVADAASRIAEIEALYAAGFRAEGATAAKRELAKASADYLAHHGNGVGPELEAAS